MSDDRIPKDLKQAIKNRKGKKLKNKVSEAIFGGKNKKDKDEKKNKFPRKIKKDIDTTMELLKTPQFKGKERDAFRLAIKLDKPVPGGIGKELAKQELKNKKPVTMNMGGQVDGVEDLTTEMEVID